MKLETLREQVAEIKFILNNEIKHELILHRWLLSFILSIGGALVVALIIKLLVW